MGKSHHKSEVGNGGVIALLVAGILLLAVAGSLWAGAEKGEDTWFSSALSFGACFVGLGLYFGWKNREAAAQWAEIPESWASAKALGVRFVYGSDGSYLPGRLVARYRDAAGVEREVRSGELGYDPRPFLPAEVTVRYEGEQARIETAFLPEAKFQDWPSLCETVPDIREMVRKEGERLETRFAGYKAYADVEDGKYSSRGVMVQRMADGVLYVMEGFVETNEKAPFVEREVGQVFLAWVKKDDAGMYWVER
jgi:hypothetical protein